jgi:SAM-dependent methyltransferase
MSDQLKFTEESNRFSASGDSHDLPKIADWYSENVLSHELTKHTGAKSFQELVLQGIKNSRRSNTEFVLVSLGAGHGQIENELLKMVPSVSPGDTHFYAIDLFSPNDMVETLIDGATYRLTRISQDLNKPAFPQNADMIIVHHALHHFVALEKIFESIHGILLRNSGTLVIADMVGRNGHMRWPESLRAIRRIWRALPQQKRFNNQFHKTWEIFENWDCSSEGFEGIRSEDILKPLFQYFESNGSFFWGGVLDPFIDRGFGDNFDPNNPKDVEIIKNVIRVESKLIDFGYLTATQVIGSFNPRKVQLSPSFTNFLSSKKYFGELSPSVKKHIDEVVDSFFLNKNVEPKPIAMEDVLKNKNLEKYLLNGWNVSDPTAIWGVGLESRIALSLPKSQLAAIEINCLILDRAKFGEVQVIIDSEISISQPLTPRTLIHMPPVSLDTVEVIIRFTDIDTSVESKDKRLITFCMSRLTLHPLIVGDGCLVIPQQKFFDDFGLKIRLYATKKVSSFLPLKLKTTLKSFYITFVRRSR